MQQERREKLLVLWLLASAFGIMFAVLSWAQEASLLPPADELGAWKGVIAVVTGLILYFSWQRTSPEGRATSELGRWPIICEIPVQWGDS